MPQAASAHMRFIHFIQEFWASHKRSIVRYGSGALLFLSALVLGKIGLAVLILTGVLIMYAVERWGEPYRLLGEAHFEQRKLERQKQAQELRESLREWLLPPNPAPPPPKPVEEPPEEDEFVGTSFLHEVTPEPPKPPVTHET